MITATERFDEIAVAWGVFFSAAQNGIDKRQASAEAILHEISHGLALGFRTTHKMPDRVSRHFDKINNVSPVLGLVLEAQALAIESAAFDALKWHRRPKIMKLLKHVWRSGLSGTAMPWPAFLTMYRRFRKEPGTAKLAAIAARQLNHLVKKHFGEGGGGKIEAKLPTCRTLKGW